MQQRGNDWPDQDTRDEHNNPTVLFSTKTRTTLEPLSFISRLCHVVMTRESSTRLVVTTVRNSNDETFVRLCMAMNHDLREWVNIWPWADEYGCAIRLLQNGIHRFLSIMVVVESWVQLCGGTHFLSCLYISDARNFLIRCFHLTHIPFKPKNENVTRFNQKRETRFSPVPLVWLQISWYYTGSTHRRSSTGSDIVVNLPSPVFCHDDDDSIIHRQVEVYNRHHRHHELDGWWIALWCIYSHDTIIIESN